jgi:hypothetical protein
MPVAFPDIRPSSRSYSPGSFPQTEFRAQNGALTVVRLGSRRVDSELSLEFQNITDADAALILTNYEAVNSTWDYVTFTVKNGALGASGTLAKYIREVGGSGLRWRYAEPPSITSILPGRSTVQCKFIGIMDGA